MATSLFPELSSPYSHPRIAVWDSILNNSECQALVHQFSQASVTRDSFKDILIENHRSVPGKFICDNALASDAVRRVHQRTLSHFQGSHDTFLVEYVDGALRSWALSMSSALSHGPLPWYSLLFGTWTYWAFARGLLPKLSEIAGRVFAARYLWSWNGHPVHSDSCGPTMFEKECMYTEKYCCAWRTHSAVLFLASPKDAGFSGGDFFFMDPDFLPGWKYLQFFFGWKRVTPECGKMVSFSNSAVSPLWHATLPIWPVAAPSGAADPGRYTINVWFTDVLNEEAMDNFVKLGEFDEIGQALDCSFRAAP